MTDQQADRQEACMDRPRRKGTTPLKGRPLDDNGRIEFQYSERRVDVFERALRSIAANSCCAPCREASLVAQRALAAGLPAAGEAHSANAIPTSSDAENKTEGRDGN